MTTHDMTAQQKTKLAPPDRHQTIEPADEPVDPIEPVDEEQIVDEEREKLAVQDRHQTIGPPD
ncbi:MAG: hypothetical protein ACRDP3_16060 [Streptomyces sp.]|uniref:hypothetical protein n=1 Tax=Streptomyces sp. TaxID=1931 RepID=UPI003D6AC942